MHKWDLIYNSCTSRKHRNATKHTNECTTSNIQWCSPVLQLAFRHSSPGSCPERQSPRWSDPCLPSAGRQKWVIWDIWHGGLHPVSTAPATEACFTIKEKIVKKKKKTACLKSSWRVLFMLKHVQRSKLNLTAMHFHSCYENKWK